MRVPTLPAVILDNMRIIHATIPSAHEPSFQHAQEAIEFGKLIDDRRHWEINSESVVGRQIVSCYWNNSNVSLGLSADRELAIWTTGSTVNWASLSLCGDLQSVLPGESEGTVAVRLGDIEFLWDRTGVKNQMIGRTIKRLYASSGSVFLYVDGISIIHFSTIVDQSSGDPILLWILSE